MALLLTMLVSFSISFSLMWWQRSDARRGPPLAAEMVPVAVEAIPRPAVERPARQPAVREPAGESPQAAVASQARAAEIAANSEDKPEMPVIFTLVKTTAYVDDENREGVKVSKEVHEGIVFNNSEKTLELAITEVNLPTMEKSESEFTLARGNQRHFGVAQGLKMLSGDQITLRNQSYRDITKTIP